MSDMITCEEELRELSKNELIARLYWVIQMTDSTSWGECASKLLETDIWLG